MTMNANEVARLLSLLVRSDDDALAYFQMRARTRERVPIEELRWWRQHLEQLAIMLEAGNVDELERYRSALDVVREAGPPEARREVLEEQTSRPPASSGAAAPRGIAAARPSFAQKPPPAVGASPWTAAQSVQDAPAGSGDELDGTSFMTALDESFARDKKALPFEGAAPAPAPVADALPEHPDAGETAFVDVSNLQAHFQSAAIDVDTYAAIVAQTEGATPERRRTVHTQYGIDDAMRKELDASFAAQLEADASLKARFEHALRRWRGWLGR